MPRLGGAVILSNVNNTPLRVFDDQIVEFLSKMSAELMRSPLIRQYPDLAAFAFYIRLANLLKLKETQGDLSGRLGRGLCFHIAPANIPINFAFSWVFSLLAGNANVVRLPSKDYSQVAALLAVINKHLMHNPELAARNAFVRYPRTDIETTAAYSMMADCRMIWGGDGTIATVRALPVKPRCLDIAFADRYSIGLINGQAVLEADESTLMRLAQDFYNDTYLMDQNACSSPQLVLWENDSDVARQKFWNAVFVCARERYSLQDAVSVDKFTALCEESVDNLRVRSVDRRENLLYRIELSSLDARLMDHRGKAGFFFEYALKSRQELFDVVTEKYQTVTQFGIDAVALREEIVSANLCGIDRIVPFGKAMDIGSVWDGFDLVQMLSRIIMVGKGG